MNKWHYDVMDRYTRIYSYSKTARPILRTLMVLFYNVATQTCACFLTVRCKPLSLEGDTLSPSFFQPMGALNIENTDMLGSL